MECETHDKQFIHDKTGLSAEAIEQLIKWNEKTKLPDNKFYRNSILFISDLLECCGIQAAALAQNVSNYLFYRKISEIENLTSQITKGIYDKYEVGRTRASYKFLDCLEYIYKHSKNIPTKESLQTAYPKTEEEKYLDDIYRYIIFMSYIKKHPIPIKALTPSQKALTTPPVARASFFQISIELR